MKRKGLVATAVGTAKTTPKRSWHPPGKPAPTLDRRRKYGAATEQSDRGEHAAAQLAPVDLVRIGLVAIAAIASWFHLWTHFASYDAIALTATLAGGYPIFR